MNSRQTLAKEEVVVTTMRLPRSLVTEAKIQAIRAGRTFNAHLVKVLEEATGAEFGDATPAAVKAHKDHSEAPSHAAE
ncbi:hypothetical protein HOY34_11225 [Xinfangfangia sp. D13-10-4-6]|uniref:hypothetical protein n=1 Tax=Pseudogemmobacter hezensis TaxID=2737662 RepID=UPI001551EA55|nr:hypothetical protein [Pseudogemmobacter hezensis]NPD15774.1 hypothetical protein [Pseudogemmobacter hezensis]